MLAMRESVWRSFGEFVSVHAWCLMIVGFLVTYIADGAVQRRLWSSALGPK